MRLIGQEVDALAEHQLNEFAGERLLTGLALKCRSRPEADSWQASLHGQQFARQRTITKDACNIS